MDEKPTEAAPSPEPEVEEVEEVVAEPIAEVSAEAAPVVESDEKRPRVPLWSIFFEVLCLVGGVVGIFILAYISTTVGPIIIASSALGIGVVHFLEAKVLIRKDVKKIDDKEISNG